MYSLRHVLVPSLYVSMKYERKHAFILIHLFISCKLYSYNFVTHLHKMQLCLLNANVKRGLLENCSGSSVTKLKPTDITSVGLIVYAKIKPPCRRLQFCRPNLYHSHPNKARPSTNHATPEGPVQPCGPVHFSVAAARS